MPLWFMCVYHGCHTVTVLADYTQLKKIEENRREREDIACKILPFEATNSSVACDREQEQQTKRMRK